MSNNEDNATPINHEVKNKPTSDYAVGYCKPPTAHRFKHGNKANPRGRRKGSRNRKLKIQEVLFEAVTVREGGEIRQMSVLEAVLKKTLSKALAGDNKAALTIIGIAQKEGMLTPEQEQAVDNLSESDAAIMDDVRRRLEASTSEHPSEAPQATTRTPDDAGPAAPALPATP